MKQKTSNSPECSEAELKKLFTVIIIMTEYIFMMITVYEGSINNVY